MVYQFDVGVTTHDLLSKGILVDHYVWVEAVDAEESDYKAQRIGLYFDGVDNNQDCSCCGDRWSSKSKYEWNNKGQENPPTIEDLSGGWHIGSYAHHADGQITTVVVVNK